MDQDKSSVGQVWFRIQREMKSDYYSVESTPDFHMTGIHTAVQKHETKTKLSWQKAELLVCI